MKAQKMEELLRGPLGFDIFIRLVFSRAMKVTAVCLALTCIVWLVYVDKYTLASFLAGAAAGLLVFLLLCILKRPSGYRKTTGISDTIIEVGDPAQREEIQPKAAIKD